MFAVAQVPDYYIMIAYVIDGYLSREYMISNILLAGKWTRDKLGEKLGSRVSGLLKSRLGLFFFKV